MIRNSKVEYVNENRLSGILKQVYFQVFDFESFYRISSDYNYGYEDK